MTRGWQVLLGSVLALGLSTLGIVYGISSWQFSLLWMAIVATLLYVFVKHRSQGVSEAPATIGRMKQGSSKPPKSGCCH